MRKKSEPMQEFWRGSSSSESSGAYLKPGASFSESFGEGPPGRWAEWNCRQFKLPENPTGKAAPEGSGLGHWSRHIKAREASTERVKVTRGRQRKAQVMSTM